MKKVVSVLTVLFIMMCGCSSEKAIADSTVSAQSISQKNEAYDIDDLIVLQDFLLGKRITGNGKDFDLNDDGCWDVFDLCLMKREVIKNINNKQEENTMYITVGNAKLSAALAENSAAEELKNMLKKSPLTIDMSDYGSFEKVGEIGTSLPKSDTRITTETGDLMLYQGNKLVMFYDSNSWSYTPIGKINNITQDELKKVLGTGDVTITLSLE